ncbi:MAG: hypothetical protein CM15mP1_0970 [Methanobacteriota archaeon]|nr:MAG: hypothetical protein CM15mP1_0970 [Euryarchaeota archaeon]
MRLSGKNAKLITGAGSGFWQGIQQFAEEGANLILRRY